MKFFEEEKDAVRKNCSKTYEFLRKQTRRIEESTYPDTRKRYLELMVEYFQWDQKCYRFRREYAMSYVDTNDVHGEGNANDELREYLNWLKEEERQIFRSLVLAMERYGWIKELKPESAAWILELKNLYFEKETETEMEL